MLDLAPLLPARVVVEQCAGDLDEPLLPAEEGLVASGPRRAELATGRALARRALQRLGRPAGPVPRGERGAPTWPDGVVGSITHCAGLRAAALAAADDVAGLGVDAEPLRALPPGVLEVVASADERAHLADLGGGPVWPLALFCAKEAVYKVWSPRTGLRLDHDRVRVVLAGDGRFTATAPAPLGTVTGRWAADHAHVAAALAVPAR